MNFQKNYSRRFDSQRFETQESVTSFYAKVYLISRTLTNINQISITGAMTTTNIQQIRLIMILYRNSFTV